jgi:hypothetical protein
MNTNDQDKLLRQLADSFIDVANRHCEQQDKNVVNTAFLYAASRFSAFVAAASAGDLNEFRSRQTAAGDFFTAEFNSMLNKNLSSYEKVFQQQDNKYSHLVNTDSE